MRLLGSPTHVGLLRMGRVHDFSIESRSKILLNLEFQFTVFHIPRLETEVP